jgi:hypothetical protein
MKRQILLHFCCGLLVWAVFDDIVAAETPDPDDDAAAAADNDCVQWTPVSLQLQVESKSEIASRACSHGLATGAEIVRTFSLPGTSYPLLDLLYLFMSLQR